MYLFPSLPLSQCSQRIVARNFGEFVDSAIQSQSRFEKGKRSQSNEIIIIIIFCLNSDQFLLEKSGAGWTAAGAENLCQFGVRIHRSNGGKIALFGNLGSSDSIRTRDVTYDPRLSGIHLYDCQWLSSRYLIICLFIYLLFFF
jgi:hypothetical protein